MTLDEFRALKKGDRIDNAMSGSSGMVVESQLGRVVRFVSVRWDGAGDLRTFSEHTTAWMHWTLAK